MPDPVDALPYEILILCIVFAVDGLQGGPLELLGVSRRWDRLVLSTPCLWNQICIENGEEEISRISMFIQLSRSCPLHVNIMTALPTMDGLQLISDHISRVATISIWPGVSDTITALHMERWKTGASYILAKLSNGPVTPDVKHASCFGVSLWENKKLYYRVILMQFEMETRGYRTDRQNYITSVEVPIPTHYQMWEEQITRTIGIFAGTDADARADSIRVLVKLASCAQHHGAIRMAIPSFIELLKDDNRSVLLATVYALQKFTVHIGLREPLGLVIPSLIKLLEDNTAGVRFVAVSLLGKLAKYDIFREALRPAIPSLTKLLGDEDSKVQSTAAVLLGKPAEDQFKIYTANPIVPFFTTLYFRAQQILTLARGSRDFHMLNISIARQALHRVILLNDLVYTDEGLDDQQMDDRELLEDELIELENAMKEWSTIRGFQDTHTEWIPTIKMYYDRLFQAPSYFENSHDPKNYERLLEYDTRSANVFNERSEGAHSFTWGVPVASVPSQIGARNARCPGCRTLYEGAADGSVQCLPCSGQFQIETQVEHVPNEDFDFARIKMETNEMDSFNLTGKVLIQGREPHFSGNYSVVYRGRLGSNRVQVAVKIIRPVGALDTMQRKILRERKVWESLDHPNILPFYGYANDNDFLPFGAFISPWYPNGDVGRFLQQYGRPMQSTERFVLWKGVLNGVAFLHSQSPVIIHGDLSPGCILIDDDGNPRISDFGLSRIIQEAGTSGMTTTSEDTGNARYLAPELLTSEVATPTTASDVYALGCLGLEIIYLEKPYTHRANNIRGGIYIDISRGLPPSTRKEDIHLPLDIQLGDWSSWDLIKILWHADPRMRPSAAATASVKYDSDTVDPMRPPSAAAIVSVKHGSDEVDPMVRPSAAAIAPVNHDSDANGTSFDLTRKIVIRGHVPEFVGNYSVVYRGKWDGNAVAVKVLRSVGALSTMRQRVRRERMVWEALDHPNILPFYGHADDAEFQPFGAFISPWYSNGDVGRFLELHGRNTEPAQRVELWKGVLSAVVFLHSRDPVIVHGDLKPGNVLIDDNGNPRICDFGLAKILQEADASGMETTIEHTGTDRYLSPELVTFDLAEPTPASDVYALGCLGLELIYLERPHAHLKNNQHGSIIREIGEGVPPATRREDVHSLLDTCYGDINSWEILEACWRADPTKRPTAALVTTLVDPGTMGVNNAKGVHTLRRDSLAGEQGGIMSGFSPQAEEQTSEGTSSAQRVPEDLYKEENYVDELFRVFGLGARLE